MARTPRNRPFSPKSIIEKAAGKKIDRNVLSATHKVQIMEYLLACSIDEMAKFTDNSYPTFVVECSLMLMAKEIDKYLRMLQLCKQIEREEKMSKNEQK